MNEDFSLGKMSADARLTATFKYYERTGNGNADGNQPEQSVCTDQRSGFSNRPCRQAGIGSCFRI